jgi:hypothetical protein
VGVDKITQPSIDQLMAENARLRQQLAEKRRGVHIDMESGTVEIHDMRSASVQIDDLQLKLQGLSKLSGPLLDPSTLQNPDRIQQLLSDLPKYPMTIEKAKLRISEQAMNQVLTQRPVEGMQDLKVKLDQSGDIRLSGYATKAFFKVPFEVRGTLAPEKAGAVRFKLEGTKVAGFLPVPNLVTNLFASLATREMAQAQIRQDQGDFVVSTKDMVPSNIGFGLEAINVQDGFLVIEAGQPKQG